MNVVVNVKLNTYVGWGASGNSNTTTTVDSNPWHPDAFICETLEQQNNHARTLPSNSYSRDIYTGIYVQNNVCLCEFLYAHIINSILSRKTCWRNYCVYSKSKTNIYQSYRWSWHTNKIFTDTNLYIKAAHGTQVSI